MTVSAAAVQAAAHRIAPMVRRTPVVPFPDTRHAWLKLENLQVTGSFKVRGAANRLLRLEPHDLSRGVVACSSGNHGRAVAFVARRLGIDATICVPEWVDASKLGAIEREGATVELVPGTYDNAEHRAAELARERQLTPVHPFDDPSVIAGQGTIALELLHDLDRVDQIVVPLSGGGLIAGIGSLVKHHRPACRVVAVSAERASVMHHSVAAGHPVPVTEHPTIANALAGGIGNPNRFTFDIVSRVVDEFLLVSESAIEEAIRFAASRCRIVLEGGGATGVAAVLEGAIDPSPGTVVVASGGNIDPAALSRVLHP